MHTYQVNVPFKNIWKKHFGPLNSTNIIPLCYSIKLSRVFFLVAIIFLMTFDGCKNRTLKSRTENVLILYFQTLVLEKTLVDTMDSLH